MRPLKLTLKAFGPYANVQVIDFGELKDRGIFLIHGPTGSGKTTILDGICFALYGDSSGAERNGKDMRSQFASEDQETEVIFEFRLKDQKYRVSRKPEQERPKKSGGGKRVQPNEAVLWKIDDNGGETVIRSGWRNVTDSIEKIIGFRSEQFRQVIILPQGQFRELLVTDSKGRQEILERLFHTEIYRNIEEFLKGKTRELKDQIKSINEEISWNLKKADYSSTEELQKSIDDGKMQLKSLCEELKNRDIDLEKVRKTLEKGKEGNQKLTDLDEAITGMEKLKMFSGEYDKKRKSLKDARQAATLEESENSTRLRSKDKQDHEKDLNTKEALFKDAVKKYDESQKSFGIEKGREKEREDARKKVIELESYTEKVKSLESSRKNIEDMKKVLINHEDDGERLKKHIEELKEKIKSQEKIVNEAREISGKVPFYKAKYDEAERLLSKRVDLGRRTEEFLKANKEWETNLAAFKKNEDEYLKAKKEFFVMQDSYNRGQAAILAYDLKENQPCPVCGSIHHPDPAHMEKDIPSQEDLKLKKESMEALEKEKDSKSERLNASETAKKTLESSIADMERELGDSKDMDISILEQAQRKAKELLDESLSVSERLDELNEKLEIQNNEEAEDEEKAQKLDMEIKSCREQYQVANGALSEREESIPENIRNISGLLRELKNASEMFESMSRHFENVKSEFDDASNMLTAAKTSRDNSEKALKEITQKYQEEKDIFRRKLHEANFEDYSRYENAKMKKESIDALEKDIRDYEGRMHSAADMLDRARADAEGVQKEDLFKLETAVYEAESERDRIFTMENTLSLKISSNETILNDLKKLNKKLDEKEKKYGVLGTISDVANGQYPNKYGITLERFILGWLLDEITAAATERLKLMSRGRYYLERTLDRERKNSAGGLELEVFDSYTGFSRPVTTLSGGESFLASLSLALGLADVVQSYSGGISLDTIFVDEGFGTLDPESLDFAVKTLIDLQKGGRLVGVISHVPELRERIDARLEVTPTEKGSTACFKVS